MILYHYKVLIVQAEIYLLQGARAEAATCLKDLEVIASSGLPKSDQLLPLVQARYLPVRCAQSPA